MDYDDVLVLKDYKTVPDIVHEYSPSVKHGHVPLVIDNGSYQCRVGWSTSEDPCLIFKNLIARPRKDRSKKDAEPPVTPPIQIGNDILNIEAVRFQLKTQFDKNVVTHFEVQEQVLDYIFSHLGVDSEGCVSHPLVMTEPFVNPNYSRQLMSELLFEGYGVPAVSYGIDSIFSMCRNEIGANALVINFGYHTIHIIPVLRGKIIYEHSRRINLGGSEMAYYLHKLLQLKYPVHVNAITMSRAEEILTEHCAIALDYQEQIRKWASPEFYEAQVKRVQLPFVQSSSSTPLSVEAQKERKKEMARRLLEINARKREERLAEDEEQLAKLMEVSDLIEEGDADEFNEALKNLDVKSYEDLQRQISVLNARIEKSKLRIAEGLTSACEPRPSARVQPPSEPAAFSAWLSDVRTRYSELVSNREARRARRADMARRRTAAAAERMRLISHLAAAGDDFGTKDSDWDAYKSISREADSDSEADAERILELEETLREHEPQPSANRHHQLHVAIEAIRAPELIFQPSMMGNQEAGLAETMEYVFKHFSDEDQLLLANNVFLTGGCSQFPGLKERIERELLEMRPFKSTHRVVMSKNANLDAWYGARDFAENNDFDNRCITRREYYEMGGEYLKEHHASNKYYKSPEPLETTLIPAVDVSVAKEVVIVDS